MRTTLYAFAIFAGAFCTTLTALCLLDRPDVVQTPITVVQPPVAAPAPAPAPEIPAEPQSYDEARALATKLGRKLVVMFSGSHCPPCKSMKATTLQNDEIKKLLKDKFVFYIALDDGETNSKFGISAVPTYHILNPKTENVIRTARGYKDVDEFKKFLTLPNASDQELN